VACPGVDVGLVSGLLLGASACVVVIHALSQSKAGSSALRIALYMWQVALLVVDHASWLHWAAFLDLNFLTAGGGSACPFPTTGDGMLLLRLLGPLLCFVLLAATAALDVALGRCGCNCYDCKRWPLWRSRAGADGAFRGPREPAAELEDGADIKHNYLSRYARSVVALYFFTFNQITSQCLEFFGCQALPDGHSYMTTLPAVRCDSDAHRAIAPLAWVLLLLYSVAVPVFIAVRLWSLHRQRRLAEAAVQQWWGGVYASYHEGRFWSCFAWR
jgi:hypothetical protein